MDQSKRFELKNPPLAALLAWLVPGLGHWYQGRRGKAILYFVCIMGTFLFGFGMGSFRNVYFRMDDEEWRLPYFAQVGAGAIALPALITDPGVRSWLPGPLARFEAAPTKEVDNALNANLASDLDELHRDRGKLMDMALIYTMIAGLLNFLVIFDAFAGPAAWDEEQKWLAARRKPATA